MPAHLLTDVKIRKAKHLDVVDKLSDGRPQGQIFVMHRVFLDNKHWDEIPDSRGY